MPEEPEQKQESFKEVLAKMRAVADDNREGEPIPSGQFSSVLAGYADRIEAAVKREMDEAAEFIDDYLNEIPVYHPPHDWLIRNGYKDTSYQNDIHEGETTMSDYPATPQEEK